MGVSRHKSRSSFNTQDKRYTPLRDHKPRWKLHSSKTRLLLMQCGMLWLSQVHVNRAGHHLPIPQF